MVGFTYLFTSSRHDSFPHQLASNCACQGGRLWTLLFSSRIEINLITAECTHAHKWKTRKHSSRSTTISVSEIDKEPRSQQMSTRLVVVCIPRITSYSTSGHANEWSIPYAMLASWVGGLIRYSVLLNCPPPTTTLSHATTTQRSTARHNLRTNTQNRNRWRGACRDLDTHHYSYPESDTCLAILDRYWSRYTRSLWSMVTILRWNLDRTTIFKTLPMSEF